MMIKTFAAAVHGIDAAMISVETDVARVGGGTYPQPDEILLVHNGVLFWDEFPDVGGFDESRPLRLLQSHNQRMRVRSGGWFPST